MNDKSINVSELKDVLGEVFRVQLAPIHNRLDNIESTIHIMKGDIQDIKKKQDIIYVQVGKLTEAQTDTTQRLERVEKKVDTIRRHDRILKALAVRSIEQEGEIRKIKKS